MRKTHKHNFFNCDRLFLVSKVKRGPHIICFNSIVLAMELEVDSTLRLDFESCSPIGSFSPSWNFEWTGNGRLKANDPASKPLICTYVCLGTNI